MLPSAKAARGVSVGRKILHPHADLSLSQVPRITAVIRKNN